MGVSPARQAMLLYIMHFTCRLQQHPFPSGYNTPDHSAGDAENDVGMLGLAGIGVCVGNASPPARAAARFVTLTNAEDGAAVAMEQLLRSKEPPTRPSS